MQFTRANKHTLYISHEKVYIQIPVYVLFLTKTLHKLFLFNLSQFHLNISNAKQSVLEKCTRYLTLSQNQGRLRRCNVHSDGLGALEVEMQRKNTRLTRINKEDVVKYVEWRMRVRPHPWITSWVNRSKQRLEEAGRISCVYKNRAGLSPFITRSWLASCTYLDAV